MLVALLFACSGPTALADSNGGAELCHPDADHDGFGSPEFVECRAGVAEDATDCDDENRDISPDAEEVCDEVDNNCDRRIDEGFDVTTWYVDADADGDGDPAASTESCLQPPGTVPLGGDCDDQDAAVSSLTEEICGDGIDNDCVDGDEVCHIVEERSLSDAGAKVLPPNDSLYFGESLWLNEAWGDPPGPVGMGGTSDVDETKTYVGVITGRRGMWQLSDAELAVVNDESMTEKIGGPSSVLDLTEDGVEDQVVIVSADINFVQFGVIPGPVSGTIGFDDIESLFYSETAVYGSGVQDLGDNDEDGHPEIALGFWGDSFTTNDGWAERRGKVYVQEAPFPANVDLDDVGIAIEASSSLEHSMFGYSLCSADLDGDGLVDLGVGAPAYGDIYSGAVVVLLAPFDTNRWVKQDVVGADGADGYWGGDDSYSNVGYSLGCKRDVDRDGLPDLVFGGPGREDYAGAAWLVPGPALGDHHTDEAPWSMFGEADWDDVGNDATADSDLDGDGFGDITVAADGADGAGFAAIFHTAESGSHTWADADVLWRGEQPGDYARSLAAGGDLDGDGFDDLLVGAFHESTVGQYAGAAYIVFGGVQ